MLTSGVELYSNLGIITVYKLLLSCYYKPLCDYFSCFCFIHNYDFLGMRVILIVFPNILGGFSTADTSDNSDSTIFSFVKPISGYFFSRPLNFTVYFTILPPSKNSFPLLILKFISPSLIFGVSLNSLRLVLFIFLFLYGGLWSFGGFTKGYYVPLFIWIPILIISFLFFNRTKIKEQFVRNEPN